MKRYDTYKDSCIQWLGEIPSHWNVCRVKSLFSHVSGNGFKLMYQGKQEGQYPFCKASDINGSEIYVSSANNYVNEDVAKAEGYNIIPKNSILFSKIGEALKKNHRKINTIPCIVDNNCSALVNNSDENILYYYYVLKNVDMIWFDNGGVIPCVNVRKLMSCGLPLPPLAEQEAIVAFLDEKTAEIDDMVAQVEREIELLKEFKQAEIAYVVTHGLDPNVPMKPSGISWADNIPQHWGVKRLGSAFTENKENNNDLALTEAYKFYYGSLVRKDEDVSITEDIIDTYKKYTVIKPNDILINGLNLNYDFISQRVAISHNNGIITSAYLAMTPRENVNALYYCYLLKSMDAKKLFHGMGTGIRLTLSFAELKKQLILFPPLAEQQEIVDYINRKTADIDRLVVELTYQVEYLKEYKQRLIADVVTGKINVQPN